MTRFKTPAFWYRDSSAPATLCETVLAPASIAFKALASIKQNSAKPYKASIPVICIGNITAGGSGKTPTAIAIFKYIKQHHYFQKPVFLTRGYGGVLNDVVVDLKRHKSGDTGDEPLLLAKYAPTLINADRAAGAKTAEAMGADLIIMDDGMQNYGLHKNLTIQVIDGESGYGNGKIIPAGPLRQSIKDGAQYTDIFIIIGEDIRGVLQTLPSKTLPIYAKITPTKPPAKDLRYIAFSGLGHPQKFFNFARAQGLTLVETIPFPDHHDFKAKDLDMLAAKAKIHNAQCLTTEKDLVRIPPGKREGVHTLPIKLEFEDTALLEKHIHPLAHPEKAETTT